MRRESTEPLLLRRGGTFPVMLKVKIESQFIDKGVGAVDVLLGKLDNIPLCVFAMKEEYYVMMMMSTYGENSQVVEDKLWTFGGERMTTVHNRYQYRYVVDSHN